MRGIPSIVAAGVLLFAAEVADAAPNRQACVSAYEESQTRMRRGQLHDARASLQTCLDEACPSTLRADCAGWLKEVESRQPSVVVECVQDGAPVKDAKLLVDGKAAAIDGRSLELDPGTHAFAVEAKTGTTSVEMLLREGEKLKSVRLELPSTKKPEAPPPVVAKPLPPPPPKQTVRPVPWTVWAAGGLGVASLGAFGVFAAIGKSKQHDLEACKPTCSQSSIDGVHGKYVVADVFLGVGVVGVAAATVLYFTRPKVTVERSALLRLATGQPVTF